METLSILCFLGYLLFNLEARKHDPDCRRGEFGLQFCLVMPDSRGGEDRLIDSPQRLSNDKQGQEIPNMQRKLPSS